VANASVDTGEEIEIGRALDLRLAEREAGRNWSRFEQVALVVRRLCDRDIGLWQSIT
jgi:hypothetical protein